SRAQTHTRLCVDCRNGSVLNNCSVRIDDNAADLSRLESADIAAVPEIRFVVLVVGTVNQDVLRSRRKQLSRKRVAAKLFHVEPIGKQDFPRQQIHRNIKSWQTHVVTSILSKSRSETQVHERHGVSLRRVE